MGCRRAPLSAAAAGGALAGPERATVTFPAFRLRLVILASRRVERTCHMLEPRQGALETTVVAYYCAPLLLIARVLLIAGVWYMVSYLSFANKQATLYLGQVLRWC